MSEGTTAADAALAQVIVGPVLLGQVFALTAYGVLLSTFYHYSCSEAWPRISRILKVTVWAVVVLNAFECALAAHDIWYYGTLLSDDVYTLLAGTLVECLEPLVSGLVAAIVQTLLAIRGSRGIWMWFEAGTDLIISLVYVFLIRQRIKAGVNDVTGSVLRLIITITLQSASYTAILALVTAIINQIFSTESSNLSQYSPDDPYRPQQQSPHYNPSVSRSSYSSDTLTFQPPTTMPPGPLRRPIALPQTGTSSASPFLRGFSTDLEDAGVCQREFMTFVDALNVTIIPNPEVQIAAKAAGIAGWFVPGLAAGIALTGVQVVAGVGGAVQVKGATKTCLQTANQNLFGPCGLEVQLMSTQQLNNLIGIYSPPSSSSTFSLDPLSRLQQLGLAVAPVSSILPPLQASGRQDPLAQLGAGLTSRSQKKAEEKASKDAAKGKMKKSDKLDGAFLWLVVVNAVGGAGGYGGRSGQRSAGESFERRTPPGQEYGQEEEYYERDRK
ncbi:hypothetical protein MNV49_002221 [Pseudohyphozyma bogoriensis]|nr:hypothetical protein MNV49_002221 [Pseudohyphozyma bogoriensis]